MRKPWLSLKHISILVGCIFSIRSGGSELGEWEWIVLTLAPVWPRIGVLTNISDTDNVFNDTSYVFLNEYIDRRCWFIKRLSCLTKLCIIYIRLYEGSWTLNWFIFSIGTHEYQIRLVLLEYETQHRFRIFTRSLIVIHHWVGISSSWNTILIFSTRDVCFRIFSLCTFCTKLKSYDCSLRRDICHFLNYKI